MHHLVRSKTNLELCRERNRSQEFQALVEKLKEGSGLDEWPSCANNHVFVFVGGLWSHFYPDSYIGALSGLLGRGIKTTRITAHDTRCSTEVNGAIIASELKKIVQKWPQKKIIIMAHSKGSLDTLEALRVDPSIAPHVQHLIAFQSPFGGSPYAVRDFSIMNTHSKPIERYNSCVPEKVLKISFIFILKLLF